MSTIKSSSEHLTLNADGASKDIKFQANGVEKASIDSSGNLTVSGNLTSVGIDDNADATAITINSDESVSFANAVVITDTINAGSSGSSGGTTGKINFGGVSGSIDGFTITNENGNYLNIKPNSSSNGIKILNTGGMCFGTDTAAANALDDYEEGTWTPTLDGATATLGNTTGYYTKIGNVVYFCWYSKASTLSSSSGNAQIHGLPFTSSNDADRYVVFSYAHGNALDGNSRGGYVSKNATKMSFVDDGAIDSATFINGSNKYIMVSGFYYVD